MGELASRQANDVLMCAGRLFQKGDVMAFGAIHKRARGVGAISAVGGFGVGAGCSYRRACLVVSYV